MIMNIVNDQLNKETNDNLSFYKNDGTFTESNLELTSEEISIIENRVQDTTQYSGFDRPYAWK
ncbi:hypothetical protein [Pseudogracilibacillus auburnensis]|uniref:hypothetical protein n=1 Tax=Pseudogracilibacillus auburnensis TaxID=1494959 RepID=UPI001A962860|nr:hypothetical protein [Pseudogracilibacillus auburnensis]MBO1004534.1 hypothetical protein [Pseudogracilibacillus auburnensis]